jgi:hypothetical protein
VDLVERMQKSLKVAQKTAGFWNGPKHLVFQERSRGSRGPGGADAEDPEGGAEDRVFMERS